jgi:RNA-binding protein
VSLSESQRKHLRKLAHNMKPTVTVGTAGITEGLVGELDSTLEHHELIKLKIRVSDRDLRNNIIDELAKTSKAELISRVGNIATIYRARKKNPKIKLPAKG